MKKWSKSSTSSKFDAEKQIKYKQFGSPKKWDMAIKKWESTLLGIKR